MGISYRTAMKIAGCILLVAAAYAAEVKMMEQMGEDVVYRISWNTQYDTTPSNTASKGTYKINIKGADSETGEQTLVTHPGYQCGAASDPECFPDITGTVLADGDASAKCACAQPRTVMTRPPPSGGHSP